MGKGENMSKGKKMEKGRKMDKGKKKNKVKAKDIFGKKFPAKKVFRKIILGGKKGKKK